jgi:hypothetical protein
MAADVLLSLDRLAVHELLPYLTPLVAAQAPGLHPRRPALALGPAAPAPPAAGACAAADAAWLLKTSLFGRLLAQRAEAAAGAPDGRAELAAARRLNTCVLVLLSNPARHAVDAAAALAALPLETARGAGAVGVEHVLSNAHSSLWFLDHPETLLHVGLCDSFEAHMAAADAAAVARRARVAASAAGVAVARPAAWIGWSLVAAGHWLASVTAENAGARGAWAAAMEAMEAAAQRARARPTPRATASAAPSRAGTRSPRGPRTWPLSRPRPSAPRCARRSTRRTPSRRRPRPSLAPRGSCSSTIFGPQGHGS